MSLLHELCSLSVAESVSITRRTFLFHPSQRPTSALLSSTSHSSVPAYFHGKTEENNELMIEKRISGRLVCPPYSASKAFPSALPWLGLAWLHRSSLALPASLLAAGVFINFFSLSKLIITFTAQSSTTFLFLSAARDLRK